MHIPERLSEAKVHGGRIVRPGDKVRLRPAPLRNQSAEWWSGHIAKMEFDCLVYLLGGEGPFVVKSIFTWRGGKAMFYFTGIGVAHAYDLM